MAADIASRIKNKQIILVSRSPLLNTLPTKAGTYAKRWLNNNQVRVLENDELVDGNSSSKKTKNGIILVNEGEESMCIDCTGRSLLLDDRSVVVDSYLRATAYPSSAGVFAGGDIISYSPGREVNFFGFDSPSNNLRNAHIAESQAEILAFNVKAFLGIGNVPLNGFLSYPQSVFYTGRSQPLLACVSLGPRSGILVFNNFVIFSFIAALAKFVIERTKVAEIREKTWGRIFWAIVHGLVNSIHFIFFSANILKNVFFKHLIQRKRNVDHSVGNL